MAYAAADRAKLSSHAHDFNSSIVSCGSSEGVCSVWTLCLFIVCAELTLVLLGPDTAVWVATIVTSGGQAAGPW